MINKIRELWIVDRDASDTCEWVEKCLNLCLFVMGNYSFLGFVNLFRESIIREIYFCKKIFHEIVWKSKGNKWVKNIFGC